MKYCTFFLVPWLLLLGFGSPVLGSEAEAKNEYGQFITTKIKDIYMVSFVLDPTNEKFKKIQKIAMFDYGNDEEGDISIIFHRKGGKEVFFRNRRNYLRFVSQEPAADVCQGDWSPKIVYFEQSTSWKCSKINLFVKWYLWGQIDLAFIDAKNENWKALTERILSNVKKIIK